VTLPPFELVLRSNADDLHRYLTGLQNLREDDEP
jgi:hypothetical protein